MFIDKIEREFNDYCVEQYDAILDYVKRNTPETTKEQEEFFKDSAIKDSDGSLRVCYHATNHEFTEFDNINKQPGYWFSTDKTYADDHGSNVLECYLNIKNPFDVENVDLSKEIFDEYFGDNGFDESKLYTKEFGDFLKSKGHDGWMWTHDGYYTIVAFEPNQIKAIENTNPTLSNDFREGSTAREQVIGEIKNEHEAGYIVSLDPMNLKYLPDEFKDNKEIVMDAVYVNGLAFQYASENLQKDYKVYTRAFNNMYADTPAEKEQLKAILEKTPHLYDKLPEEMRNDKEIAIYAMQQNPFTMRAIGPELKADKEFVLNELTKFSTFHLTKIAPELRTDKDVVRAAMELNKNFRADDLEHILKNFPEDKELVNEAIEKFDNNGWNEYESRMRAAIAMGIYLNKEDIIPRMDKYPIYNYADDTLKADKDLALAAIKINAINYKCIPDSLKADKEFNIVVVKEQPEAYKYLSSEQKKDKDIKNIVKPPKKALTLDDKINAARDKKAEKSQSKEHKEKDKEL